MHETNSLTDERTITQLIKNTNLYGITDIHCNQAIKRPGRGHS